MALIQKIEQLLSLEVEKRTLQDVSEVAVWFQKASTLFKALDSGEKSVLATQSSVDTIKHSLLVGGTDSDENLTGVFFLTISFLVAVAFARVVTVMFDTCPIFVEVISILDSSRFINKKFSNLILY